MQTVENISQNEKDGEGERGVGGRRDGWCIIIGNIILQCFVFFLLSTVKWRGEKYKGCLRQKSQKYKTLKDNVFEWWFGTSILKIE